MDESCINRKFHATSRNIRINIKNGKFDIWPKWSVNLDVLRFFLWYLPVPSIYRIMFFLYNFNPSFRPTYTSDSTLLVSLNPSCLIDRLNDHWTTRLPSIPYHRHTPGIFSSPSLPPPPTASALSALITYRRGGIEGRALEGCAECPVEENQQSSVLVLRCHDDIDPDPAEYVAYFVPPDTYIHNGVYGIRECGWT